MLDDVLLDIEPVALSADGLEFLDGLVDQPEAEWYHRRRREALAAAGLVGAYNPMQPRGKDGKWIEVFGWIRWLKDGKWRRGQVKGWGPTDGKVLVKADDGSNMVFTKNEIADRFYSIPTPKASMQLPQPGAHGAGDVDAPGFSKIGGQGGSNPGGSYQVTSPAAVKADAPITPEMIKASLDFHGHGEKLEMLDIFVDDNLATWLTTTPQLKADNALITDSSTGRTYSKIGNTFWDLGTNQPVEPEVIFGEKNSGRRHETLGHLDIVTESETLPFSDFANILSAAKSMAGTKPNKDDKFYVKTSKSPEHAQNEALANYLYELGGVPVPETSVGSDGLTFASRFVEGDEVVELSAVLGDQDVYDKLREDFVFDAWLANWDVVGQGYDNVKVVDGVPVRIDAGGALMYRAKGDPKGTAFGTDVGELESLFNPSVNPTGATVFGGITAGEMKKAAERLAAISPQDIKNAVAAHELDVSLSDKLIARRKFILDKFDVDEPAINVDEMPSLPPVLPPPEILPPLPESPSLSDQPTPKVYPSDISAMYYNADAGNFLPGSAPPDTAGTAYSQYLQLFEEMPVSYAVSKWATGHDVYVVYNDSVWKIEPESTMGDYAQDAYTLNLVHAATGEKLTKSFTSGEKLPMEATDADEMFAAAYGALFRDYRNNTVNKYRSTQAVANANNILTTGMAMENVGTGFSTTSGSVLHNFKPGQWVMDETDQLKVKAYKIDKVDMPPGLTGYSPGLTIFHGHDMDGEEVSFTGNWFLRTGKPGSVVNETLDAVQARNIVAKTAEKNDADAPTTVTFYNTSTPTDTVMQKLSASEAAIDSPFEKSYKDLVAGPPTTPEAPPVEEPEWFDPETQVNKAITVVGEPVHAPDLTMSSVEPYIGKTVYLRYKMKNGNIAQRGVFKLEKAEPYAKNSPQYGLELHFLDATGRTHIKRTKQNFSGLVGAHDSFGNEFFEIEGNIAPVLTYTEKQNGDIVVNGEVVGSWVRNQEKPWHTPTWSATVNGKYTVSGKDFRLNEYGKKKDIRAGLIPMMLAPGAGGSKPKTAKVKEIQKQIVLQQIAFGSNIKETDVSGNAVTLMDGAEVKLGMWTISKTDGKIGKIVATKVSPEAGVVGSVKVEYDDPSSPGGKMIKIRGASTLSAAINSEGELPPGSPFFTKVKLADGSQPFPSQTVTNPDGFDAVIMGIKPDGNVRVLNLIDGTKNWVKASTLTTSKHKDYTKDVIIEVDADPAGAVATFTESWKTAPKATKIPYAAPGGAVISQPSNAVAEYRKYAQGRKLTKDNFVPRIGMRVRDSKGNQLVIVRQNTTLASNPSTVYVINPAAPGKPAARQPSALWVDHAAELATWDGNPLPKVSSVSLPNALFVPPDGSTLYSYPVITHTASGTRTKVIKYMLVQPDGKVKYFGATGAAVDIQNWMLQDILSEKGQFGKVSKVAYFDAASSSTITVESANGLDMSKLWIHDSAPGALEQLKEQTAKDALAATITPLPGELQDSVEPEIFGGDEGTLSDLPKPTHVPDTGPKNVGPPPPPIQSDPARLAQSSVVPGAFSIGTAIPELKKRIAAGGPGSRVMYAMGDSDYIEDMAIRVQSAVIRPPAQPYNAPVQPDQEVIEVRFRLLEDKVDDLANRLITNNGQTKVGGWVKTPLKTPKDIVVGDAISVKISATVPDPGGGALKPAELDNPNATVISQPVLVGTTKSGLEAYRIDVVTAGGAAGSIIVENRATPSVPTYEWDPAKIMKSSHFVSTLNADAMTMGWTVRNDNSSGYEVTSGVSGPDDKGRKVVNPNGKSVRTTGQSHAGSYRLKYGGDDNSFMTVQVTHPASDIREPYIKYPHGESKGRRHSVNGEVLIRVPADDPNALDKISAMMSAAGVPPSAQSQPTGRDLRKMALNKVFKQFNLKYEHMQRPDVTGDDDASAQAVLSLIDSQVSQYMPEKRKVTMDDIELRVMPSGRMEVILSDDVAHALTAKGNFKYAYHKLNHGYDQRIWTSKAETGLLSTDERWSAGIIVEGGSSANDVTHDAGNRIFFRFSNANTLNGDIVLSATAVNKKLDNYWSPDDYWGRRQPGNTANQYLNETSIDYYTRNEVKIKRMIDPEMMAFVRIDSPTKKIAELKKAGVTNINGRPIEEVFVEKNSYSSVVMATDVDDLGMHYGNEMPITDIPLEGTVPPGAPVAAPVVIAGGTMSGHLTSGTGTGSIIFNTTSDPRLS